MTTTPESRPSVTLAAPQSAAPELCPTIRPSGAGDLVESGEDVAVDLDIARDVGPREPEFVLAEESDDPKQLNAGQTVYGHIA